MAATSDCYREQQQFNNNNNDDDDDVNECVNDADDKDEDVNDNGSSTKGPTRILIVTFNYKNIFYYLLCLFLLLSVNIIPLS